MSTATQVHIQPPVAFDQTGHQATKNKNAAFAVETNQLQFNLHATPQAYNMQTTFQKPRPIIIEKLLPASQESKVPVQVMRKDDRNLMSSLSSERLELAMQLAKRDVKKLKTMLADPSMNLAEMLENGNQLQAVAPAEIAFREPVVSKRGSNKESQKGKSSNKEPKDQKPKAGKVIASSQQQKEFRGKNFQLKFFDSEGDTLVDREESPNKGETKSKEMTEIKRLRRELQKYVKRLDSVLEQKHQEKNPTRAKARAIEEETEYERKSIRAEEQAARSARVLYMLQRKVQEIQDEIEQKGGHFKHTKKSQYLTRLAAAHRSAVRALQMFVNQAPLYYDVKHGLPPMYNELGLLIQQLSLLSSQFDVGKDVPDFDLDMLPRTKKLISSWNHGLQGRKISEPTRERQKQIKLPAQKKPVIKAMKDNFLEEHREWLKQKAQSIGATKKNLDASRESNEPTPEREAAMQAGLDAIQRAKASASYIAPEIEEKPGGVRFEIPRQIPVNREKSKSVLFPHRIKKQRQQSSTKRSKVVRTSKPKRESGQPLRFAQQTVSSVLKQQPEVIYQPKKIVPRSPKRNEIPDDVFISHGTPRQRDEDILRLSSPTSKKEIPKALVSPRAAMRELDYGQPIRAEYQNEYMQREAARQAWLDREREQEIQRLQGLGKKEETQRRGLRDGYSESQRIIKDAEEKIKETLQPLLEKAELISLQDKLKEDQYKTSVRRKLGEIVADTAMSKGELLADLILEDILTETAKELQRLEHEEDAEARAAFELDKPRLETVAQRMMEMEKEEEQIRRHWKQLHYSELKVTSENENEKKKVEKCKNAGPARPIIFTAAAERFPPAVSNGHWSRVKEAQPSHKVHFDEDDAITSFVPPEMLSSISSYRRKHDKYLKRTITEEHGNFDPWKLVERISDDIVDEVLEEIQQEMDDVCDEYIEKLYAEEFVKNDSLASELNSESISK